jgi:hypothetical protein
MIPKKDIERFEKTYGEWWFLREFDFLPEKLSYYGMNITSEFFDEARKNNFLLFRFREEAEKVSDEVRELTGIAKMRKE